MGTFSPRSSGINLKPAVEDNRRKQRNEQLEWALLFVELSSVRSKAVDQSNTLLSVTSVASCSVQLPNSNSSVPRILPIPQQSMKPFLVVLAVAFGAAVANAQLGSFNQPAQISTTTVFEWDPVSTTTDGEPVTLRYYTLAAFPVGGSTPLFTVNSTTTSQAFGQWMTNLVSSVKYETRVRAESQEGLQSPWSSPFYVLRVRQMAAPASIRVR